MPPQILGKLSVIKPTCALLVELYQGKGGQFQRSDELWNKLKLAKEKSNGLDINYSVRDGTDFKDFESGQFDVVIMNMVIHYIENLD